MARFKFVRKIKVTPVSSLQSPCITRMSVWYLNYYRGQTMDPMGVGSFALLALPSVYSSAVCFDFLTFEHQAKVPSFIKVILSISWKSCVCFLLLHTPGDEQFLFFKGLENICFRMWNSTDFCGGSQF